jgi:hypothetical protein
MNDEEFTRAKGILELLYLAKDHAALMKYSSQEDTDPRVKMYASALLLRPWLPWGKSRKVIVVVLLFSGTLGSLLTGNLTFLYLLAPIPFFSPRLVGEASNFLGNVLRKR